IGAQQQFTAEARDANDHPLGTQPTITWGGGGSVATVSETGLATATANGTTQVTATGGGVSGSAELTVQQVATSVTVSPAVFTLRTIGDSTLFTAEARDANNNPLQPQPVFTWQSSLPSVATMGDSGWAIAAGEGTTQITASGGGTSGAATLNVSLTAVIRWASATDGNWSDPTKWDPQFVPVASDNVVIDVAGTYTVTLDGTASVKSLTIGGTIGGGTTGTQMLVASDLVEVNLTVDETLMIDSTGFLRTHDVELTTGVLNNRGIWEVAGGETSFFVGDVGAAHTNSGSIYVSTAMVLTMEDATFTNTGLLEVEDNVDVYQYGDGSPSFVNSGTGNIAVWDGVYLTFSGGTFDFVTTPTSAYGGQIIFDGVYVNFTPDYATDGLQMQFWNSEVNGPGQITHNNWVDDLYFYNSVINAPVTNQAELRVQGNTTINGVLTTAPGSWLIVEGAEQREEHLYDFAELTVTSGLTNNAVIQLTNAHATTAKPAQLNVTGGPLTNASGALIDVQAGAAGGDRGIDAELDNQGTWHIEVPAMTATGGPFSNAGDLDGTGTLDVSSTTFSSTGRIEPGAVGAAGVFNMTGDVVMQSAGSDHVLMIDIGGTGAGDYDQLNVSGVATLSGVIDAYQLNGFVPSPGDEFTIMTFSSRVGSFSTTTVNIGGVTLNVVTDATSVKLVAPSP
ncbi:MAG: Ig-like domain-containing protein, partial [Gemmatimonadota bacterium]